MPEVEDRRRAAPAQVLAAVRSYPELARDLAVARRTLPGSALARQLDRLYTRLHRSLFQPAASLGHDLARLFRTDVPAIVVELRLRIVLVAIGFFLTAGAGAWLVTTFPELVRLFASEAMIEGVQSGQLWTDDLLNVVPSSLLSVRIFTNNIAVAVVAFCLGAVYGLGTIYIVAVNGLMLGTILAFTARYDLHGRLLEFIVAHGFVELSTIDLHRQRRRFFDRRSHSATGASYSGRSFSKSGRPRHQADAAVHPVHGRRGPDRRVHLAQRGAAGREASAIGVAYWLAMFWVLAGLPLPTIAARRLRRPIA